MCYSYRDRRIEEEARKEMRVREERKRRPRPKDKKGRPVEKDRELVRA
jgi:hypothetical protein